MNVLEIQAKNIASDILHENPDLEDTQLELLTKQILSWNTGNNNLLVSLTIGVSGKYRNILRATVKEDTQEKCAQHAA